MDPLLHINRVPVHNRGVRKGWFFELKGNKKGKGMGNLKAHRHIDTHLSNRDDAHTHTHTHTCTGTWINGAFKIKQFF